MTQLPPIKSMDIEHEIHEYYKFLTLSNFKKSTVTMYCRTFRLFFEFCQQHFQHQSLAQDHAQEYLLSRINDGKAWETINAEQLTFPRIDATSQKRFYHLQNLF